MKLKNDHYSFLFMNISLKIIFSLVLILYNIDVNSIIVQCLFLSLSSSDCWNHTESNRHITNNKMLNCVLSTISKITVLKKECLSS